MAHRRVAARGAIDLVYERIGVLEDALGRGETIEEAAHESKATLINFNGIDRNGFDIDGALTSEGILASVEVREADVASRDWRGWLG